MNLQTRNPSIAKTNFMSYFEVAHTHQAIREAQGSEWGMPSLGSFLGTGHPAEHLIFAGLTIRPGEPKRLGRRVPPLALVYPHLINQDLTHEHEESWVGIERAVHLVWTAGNQNSRVPKPCQPWDKCREDGRSHGIPNVPLPHPSFQSVQNH